MSFLSILFTVLAIVLFVVGAIGCFVPALPGPPLAWAGLVLAKFSSFNEIQIWVLAVTLVFVVAASILDNFTPMLMTKKAGGTKGARTGSTVGLIVGLFIGPVGVILGPFVGSFIGEFLNNQKQFKPALRVAFYTLLSFLLNTGIKLTIVMVIIWIYIFSF